MVILASQTLSIRGVRIVPKIQADWRKTHSIHNLVEHGKSFTSARLCLGGERGARQ